MTKEEFLEALKKINICLTEEKIMKLDKFYKLLISWNEKINLTTITFERDVYLKHFYDSLTLIKVIDLSKPLKVLDVGTGAGFPGIVLKIVFPNLKITLLDSQKKRINYLNEIIKELNLKDIETLCLRVEDYAKKKKEEYDLVVARAVAHLGILIETSMPLIKVKGYLIAMKGNVSSELTQVKNLLIDIKAELDEVHEFTLPIENSARTLVKIHKLFPTPLKYPRRYEIIKKQYQKSIVIPNKKCDLFSLTVSKLS